MRRPALILKQITPIGHAGHTAYQLGIYLRGDTDAGVEYGEGIAKRAIGQAANQLGGVFGLQVDFFLPGYVKQPRLAMSLG